MKKRTTLLTGAALTLMISAQSHAVDTDEVAFTYNPSAPVSTTYARLTQQAKKACDIELGPLKFYGEVQCVQDYMSDIVGKIDRPDLMAYHNHQMTNAKETIQLANLDKKETAQK